MNKTRILREANYLIDNNSTIRDTAKYFNLSKSTIHKDISKRLSKIDYNLKENVDKVLKRHKRRNNEST